MEQKSYYAILPAYVRYDKELSSTAKLLYAEITALCNEKGYCWATNQYFSDLYSVSDRQIRRILKQLVDKKYIKIIIDKNTNRKIFLIDTPDKNVLGGRKKMSGGMDKNVLHNNKSNNKTNTSNNNTSELEEEYDWLND